MAPNDRNDVDRLRLIALEDLIIQLDCTFANPETSMRKGYVSRDLEKVRDEAERIRAARRQG